MGGNEIPGSTLDVMDPEAYERWRSASEAARLRDADFDTLSSEPVEPLYTPADL